MSFLFRVVRWFTSVFLGLGIYSAWSRLYQFIWERKRSPIQHFESLSDLVSYIRTLKWRADSWKQLWDAISHPEHVQYLAETEPSRLVGDCDDFAIYEVEVWETQFKNKSNAWNIVEATMLTVTWYQPGTSNGFLGFAGHNVCLLKNKNATFSFMDYGWPSGQFATIDEVAYAVVKLYTEDATPMLWARHTRDLKCVEVKCL